MTIKFSCPYCGKRLTATPLMIGKEHTCPQCRARIQVPTESEAEPHTAGSERSSSHRPLFPAPNKGEEENLIDMTAMVDIVFFLLIFFMVTSIQALQSVMEMPQPQAEGASASATVSSDYTDDPSYITVSIQADDSIWINNQQIFSAQELRVKLREMRDENLQLTGLMVLGDPEASHGTLVTVLDAGADAGVEDLRFSVTTELDPFAEL